MIGFVVSYVRHAMLPLLTFDLPWVERPVLPMLDTNLSKRDAIPPHFWGLLYDSWKPPAPGEGASIFVTGLESRGPDNQRKRAYMAAMTPDLYDVVYRPKVLEFWDRLFAPQNSGRPLMGLYLDQYMDLFFDLHLGVSGEQVPREAKEFGLAINTVIAYADPRKWVVFKNYLGVRRRRKVVTGWIRDRIADIIEARRPGAKTFVYYWFANGISDADMEAEVLLSFFAMSQWGTALAGVTTRLCGADPVIMDEFSRAMQAGEDVALKRFVMELLRDISPNIGAFSRAKELQPPAVGPSGGYTITPLRDTSYDPKHWVNPDQFDPDRYGAVPASDQNRRKHRRPRETAVPVRDQEVPRW
jgi:cytochrome P450